MLLCDDWVVHNKVSKGDYVAVTLSCAHCYQLTLLVVAFDYALSVFRCLVGGDLWVWVVPVHLRFDGER